MPIDNPPQSLSREIRQGQIPLKWSRRQIMAAGFGAVLWPTLSTWTEGAVLNRNYRLGPNPFGLGVAAGDPQPTGAVLWTRILPDPLSDEPVEPVAIPVQWEVSHDEKFSKIMQKGTAVATPDMAHAVHVEVSGLDPDRWYFYRFLASVVPVARAVFEPCPGLRLSTTGCEWHLLRASTLSRAFSLRMTTCPKRISI